MQTIEEKYKDEFEEIISVMDSFKSVFPNVGFELDYETGNIQKFKIIVDDFQFYMENKKFKNWDKLLRKKFKRLQFFCCYCAS